MKYTTASLFVLTALVPATASAHEDTINRLDTVLVHGRGLQLIGKAEAASEGIVGYADFEDRPLSRVGELIEVIPGAVATQHSGEGKANQYFLRGFNLDHGTDFSGTIDGVPINLRTHGHGQGYLDLNFVIPEIVERVDYRKGPYYASNGDFSLAGSARYNTYNTVMNSFVDLQVGDYGLLRGVGVHSTPLSDRTDLLLAVEGQVYDGPWELSQDLQKLNGMAKLTHTGDALSYSLSATAYDSEWTATDQIPQRAVTSGLIDRFGNLDDDLGGATSRYSVSGTGQYFAEDRSVTYFSAYLVDYELSLFSNFTYFLDDPVSGDEFEQIDNRTYFGGSLSQTRPLTDSLELRFGTEIRRDNISDIGLFHTASRKRLETRRRDEIEETSVAAWAEADFTLTEKLRATLGLRGDYYTTDVTAISLPENGGSANDSLVSPSLALAWRATDHVEFYGNIGQGFHSNDARGTTIRFDPVSGDPVERVPLLVKGTGMELGARYQTDTINATIALFQLELDSELVFIGDAGGTEATDPSKRTGIETSLFWKPTDWLVIDLGAAVTDPEFDIPGNATKIPNAVESVLSAGVVSRFENLTLSGRVRHFGDAPLIEDGSIRSDPTTIVNLSASYDWKSMTFGLEVLNALDAEDNDITYYFESRLPGEAAPVEDFHFHPVEPRQLRFSVRYNF